MALNELPDGLTKDVDAADSGAEKEEVTDGEIPSSTVAQALQGLKLYAITVGVCIGALMMSLNVSMIATAIPSITSDLGDTSQISWYPAAYTFTICALTPMAGKMATIFPLNWVYLCFSCIFLIGSLVCGSAHTSNIFIVGRAIAGAGAAGVSCSGLTILLTIASDEKKPLFVGLFGGCFGVGLILGPILGGVFTEKLSWRLCFWINLPFGAVAFGVVLFFFKPLLSRKGESVMKRIRSLDLIGCTIFVPAIFMLLFALERGQDAWNSSTIIGLFVGSGVMLILFVAWEGRKGNDAMIPRSVVARRSVVSAVLFAFCHTGSLMVTSFYLPEWFQVVQGVGPLQSGIRMLPTVISQIIAGLAASAIALRVKFYNPWFFIAPVLMCTATALYTQFTTFSTPPSHWIAFQVIQGVGAGFGIQMPSLVVPLELKKCPDLLPIGISLVMFAQYLGSTVTQVIAGTIFSSKLKQQLISHAGLKASQMDLLLVGGTADVREVANLNFPLMLPRILEAYNSAITQVFFVPVAATIIAFFVAFGIKWRRIKGSATNLRAVEAESRQD